MAQTTGAVLNDDDFLYAHFDDYDADLLSAQDAERFRRLMTLPGKQALVDETKRAIGQIQLAMQSYILSEDNKIALIDIVESAEIRRTREIQRIDRVSRRESLSSFRTRLVIVGMFFGVIGAVIYFATPEKKMNFDPLNSLAYESLALEDRPEGRYDLPTSDPSDIAAFISSYKGLEFEPTGLSDVPAEWQPVGATVIDYETVRIVTIAYKSRDKQDQFFYYNYRGKTTSLPRAESFEYKGVTFYPYVSDQFNLIAWQKSLDSTAIIVGRRSAKDLATIAVP